MWHENTKVVINLVYELLKYQVVFYVNCIVTLKYERFCLLIFKKEP